MTTETTAAAVIADAQDREQLLAEKRHTIGGSDAAAIVGLNPYRTAFDVWARLTGRAPPDVEDNDRLEMGRLLEEPIARRFTRKTGLAVRKIEQLVHPRFPWATGHVDRELVDDPDDLECKTVEWDRNDEWSDSNVGEAQRVPESYFVQVAWYIMLRQYERGHYMAAQFGLSQPLRVYHWRPDARMRGMGARLLERAHDFMERHVLADVPPPLGASEGADAYLKATFPKAKGEEFGSVNDEHARELIRAVKEARAKTTEMENQRDALANELKALIAHQPGIAGAHEGLEYKASWTNVDAITACVTDHEAILREMLEMHNLEIPAELIQKHSRTVTTRAGYRLLNVSVKPPKKGRRK